MLVSTKAVDVAAVSYLNTKPLVYGLDLQTDLFQIEYQVPAMCAAWLHSNQVDLAMLSAIEYMRSGRYSIVPDVAVASYGPVDSVAMFTKRPPEDVRTIALDTSSRTSAALIRILCEQKWHVAPEFMVMNPQLDTMLEACDAALVIGDNALFAELDEGVHKVDLGQEWTEWTGLPFVWSFWAGHPERVQPQHVDALLASRNAGMTALDSIATSAFPGDDVKNAAVRDYLNHNLRFELGQICREGLKLFYDRAHQLGLARCATELRFYDA